MVSSSSSSLLLLTFLIVSFFVLSFGVYTTSDSVGGTFEYPRLLTIFRIPSKQKMTAAAKKTTAKPASHIKGSSSPCDNGTADGEVDGVLEGDADGVAVGACVGTVVGMVEMLGADDGAIVWLLTLCIAVMLPILMVVVAFVMLLIKTVVVVWLAASMATENSSTGNKKSFIIIIVVVFIMVVCGRSVWLLPASVGLLDQLEFPSETFRLKATPHKTRQHAARLLSRFVVLLEIRSSTSTLRFVHIVGKSRNDVDIAVRDVISINGRSSST